MVQDFVLPLVRKAKAHILRPGFNGTLEQICKASAAKIDAAMQSLHANASVKDAANGQKYHGKQCKYRAGCPEVAKSSRARRRGDTFPRVTVSADIYVRYWDATALN